ncbi:MAG: hypothetical protein WC796_05660 [Candidatus Pacearchaeota archaeon]|jgi:hypothetical protein
MEQNKYAGTLAWRFGEEMWDETRGSYWGTGCRNEKIVVRAASDKDAAAAAMETARQKINGSGLPGRPYLGTILVILSDLRCGRRKVAFDREANFFERPMLDSSEYRPLPCHG